MKNIIYLCLMLISFSSLHAQVLINDADTDSLAHPQAVLELRSNTRGLVLPNLQVPPQNPQEGFMYYDLTQQCFRGYADSQWVVLGGSCIVPPSVSNLQIVGTVATEQTVSLSFDFQGEQPDNSLITWYVNTDPSSGAGAEWEDGYLPTHSISATYEGYYLRACVQPYNNVQYGTTVCTDYQEIVSLTGFGFTETFKETTSDVNVNAYSNFDNATLQFSTNDATVRNTSQSNYTDTSAGANVWMPNNNSYLRIDGIDASNLSNNVSISAGIWKATTSASYNFTLQVEYSTDNGANWVTLQNPVNFPTASGWGYYTFSTQVPNSITNLRFTNLTTGTSPGMRIDDISVHE